MEIKKLNKGQAQLVATTALAKTLRAERTHLTNWAQALRAARLELGRYADADLRCIRFAKADGSIHTRIAVAPDAVPYEFKGGPNRPKGQVAFADLGKVLKGEPNIWSSFTTARPHTDVKI